MAYSITYNGLSSPASLITLTDVPNILKVHGDDGGSRADFTLTFVGDLFSQVTSDGQYTIQLFGETISNVVNPNNAVNKSFYIGRTNASTAASVAKALRNCSTLAANFLVNNNGSVVNITARDNGSMVNGGQWVESNISTQYMTRSGTDGYADELQGGLVDVDVFCDDEYVTTLEKNFYNGEVAFDMSPLLTTISEVGRIKPYTMSVSSMKDGVYSSIGSVDTNYTSVGYMCNQGQKYLINGFQYAQNMSRGKEREFANNTILYIYKPKINLSIYTGNDGVFSYTINYLDSAFNVIGTTSSSTRCYSNRLMDLEYTLDSSGYTYFQNAFYIDLKIGSHGTIRYNVIKPLKATEYSQRILWRNSYGGISFFDFTGQRSETRNLETMTYQKNIFGYYDNPMNELTKMYDNDVDYVVTLKSHLFENDGKYIFNDLMQSSEVWTEINGETYSIILDSVSCEEQNQNNIYEATVRYKYSQKPSLL